MHVQAEQYIQPRLLNAFYEQIREYIQTNYSGIEYRHYDYDFLEARPSRDNLSVGHWKNIIAKRMNFNIYSYDDSSPFSAYFINRPWLRLAYDIARLTSNNSYEYRINWLKILFPKLEIKDSQSLNEPINYLNPITFQPSVGFGKTKVLFTNYLPSFIRYKELLRQPNNTPGRDRILHEYFTKFAECYIYVLSSRELCYIFPDGSVEKIEVLPQNKDKLEEDLYRLLGVAKGAELRQLMEEDRCIDIARESIEQVIIQNGCYPILDLRPYYITDNKTRIYTVSSYFLTREMTLLNNHNPNIIIPLKSVYRKYGRFYSNFSNYSDILSQVIYDNYKSIRPRPLSVAEYMVLVSKDTTTQHTDGAEVFVRSRRLIIQVLLNKWEEMQIDIPRHYIVFLLNALKSYSTSGEVGGYAAIKRRLNSWSKEVGTSKFVHLYEKYKNDFRYLFSSTECEDVLRKYQKSQVNVSWHYSSIRQLHKLYSLLIKLRNPQGELDQYNLLNVLINIMELNSLSDFVPQAEAIVVYGLLNHIDMFQYFSKDETPYLQKLKRNLMSKSAARKAFAALLPTCPEVCKNDVNNILKIIDNIKGNLHFSSRHLGLIKKIFLNYDNEVANTEYDHTMPQSSERIAWQRLAKLLTGCGFFPDYLRLLCPNLLTYTDYVTGRQISEFDLRHLIFSTGRRYLINLTHSLDLFEVTGKAFDCNAIRLRFLDKDELSRVSQADSMYKTFYINVQKNREQEELLPFRLLIGLHRLVTNTNFSAYNRSKNYHITVRQADNEESKLTNTLYGALMSVVGYVNITVWLNKSSLCYSIDFRKDSTNNITGEIINSSLVNPILESDLEDGISSKQHLEIIYVLRKKGDLPTEFTAENEEIIEREYSVFRRLVNSLSEKQRNLLNSTNIEIGGKIVCFWEAFANARFDLKSANRFFLKFISSFNLPFTYPKQIRREFYYVLSESKDLQPKKMADPNLDLDKILISFMTHVFVPPHSIPSSFIPCSFMDVHIKFPYHVSLISLFDSFYTNYMGLTKEESFPMCKALQAPNDLRIVDETSDERQFSEEERESSARNSVEKEGELGNSEAKVTQHKSREDITGKKDNQDNVTSQKLVVTDEINFQLELFAEAFYRGFDLYHSKKSMYRIGYYQATYEWIDWIVSGEMFVDMPIFEHTEIKSIIRVLSESGLAFPEQVVTAFNELRYVETSKSDSLEREIRMVLNILCIKLFKKICREDFIRIFQTLYPVFEIELLNKVLKIYLISQNQMSLGYEGLIDAVKGVLGLDLYAERCPSPRSAFLIDTRARLKITPREIHTAINGMEIEASSDQLNNIILQDDSESVPSLLEF